ncbi:hypothetical protein CBQ26_20740 [Deinococcus indicus]|uniref:Cas12f1-like TNB domain-containing protein n=2 Tax=Deinococcus TaxID=1298 RepID=A0A246BEJ7_9DEIO|nr:zinc ribbon domain-containing protein [Deinococcus indicus]OWL93166.1 hypothetical protein CBQ26_20740 [Deinococcus indicus]
MAFNDLDTYSTRNHKESYPKLDALFDGQPSQLAKCGPRGRLFDLPTGLHVTALDSNYLQIGDLVIRTEVHALPSAPLIAVIDASPNFRQYTGLDELLTILRDPDANVTLFRERITDVVARGLHAGQPPQLVTPSSGFTAVWHPARTQFIRTPDGHWFTRLAFELTPTADLEPAAQLTTFGLDLGSSPVVCAAGGDGRVEMFGGPLPLLNALRRRDDYSAEERRVLRLLTYAAGREEAEAAIRFLARTASMVYAEQLTIEGMWGGFIATGRLQATLDFHFSWLPQALFRAGVPFERVNARGTSQVCHVHPDTIGKRDGKRFVCPRCVGVQHVDVNAARNVHARGLRQYGVRPSFHWRRQRRRAA